MTNCLSFMYHVKKEGLIPGVAYGIYQGFIHLVVIFCTLSLTTFEERGYFNSNRLNCIFGLLFHLKANFEK